MTSAEKQDYPKASNALVFGGMVTYIAGLMLIMSFSSPYWIQSYQETFSDFKHMGLWEYCFDQFRYPMVDGGPGVCDVGVDAVVHLPNNNSARVAVLLFLAVSIFGGECWRRDWLMYPNFNYLSWSYGFAVLSFFFHAFAALFLYMETRKGWELRKESHNLVVQMHPNPGRNGYV
ncbi:unnamed protein product [Timema podura]|uniref:Uncharacterized protein n=1 Tax=Timema podura TaxID=61482 RepID=A0ABN7NIR7_TIMPD|nr:unnamed protein product [Timema podura]